MAKDFDPQAMDNASIEAEQELSDASAEPDLEAGINWVIDWWYRNFMAAGHKRLGRTLVSYAKDREKEK